MQAADCLIVRVYGVNYGFCTFLYLLGLRKSRMSPGIPGGGPKLVNAPIVIHLDLFQPPCDPYSIRALCSEYVRI